MDIIVLGDKTCEVIKVAGDGNCLFASIAHQIFNFDAQSTIHQAMTMTLREMVVSYIEANRNDPTFNMLINNRMIEEFPEWLELSNDLSTRRFLDMLAQDGFWGGEETCMAIAQMFDCAINIHHEKGHVETIHQENDAPIRTINIVYSGPTNSWNHYDSLHRFDDVSNSSGLSDSQMPPPHQLVKTNLGQCAVQKTLPDGNCLFASIALQLFPGHVQSQAHIDNTLRLRQLAVEYILEHTDDARLMDMIDDRIAKDFPLWQHLGKERARMRFTMKLSERCVWGGEESIHALSNVLRCNIFTFWENGTMTLMKGRNAIDHRTVRLVYRGMLDHWYHYDSYIGFTLDGLTFTPPPPHIDIGPIDLTLSPDGDNARSRCLHQSKVSTTVPTRQIIPLLQNNHIDRYQRIKCHEYPDSQTTGSSLSSGFMGLHIGSWNVRGANQDHKREAIDNFLYANSYDVVCLQETKFEASDCQTRHYKWICGKGKNNRTYRGLAILVHIDRLSIIQEVRSISHNIMMCNMNLEGKNILLLNVHLPDVRGNPEEFQLLHQFTRRHSTKEIIIIGDFNAHVGKKDLTSLDRRCIGPNLYHDVCNDNGEELKNLIQAGTFCLKNTWNHNRSFNYTWSNGVSRSQIDHMLCNSADIKFQCMYASWVETVPTDHKILSAIISYGRAKFPQNKNKRPHPSQDSNKQPPTKKRMTWHIDNLQTEAGREQYCEAITNNINKFLPTIARSEENYNVNTVWNAIKHTIHQSADETLIKQKEQLTPKRLQARRNYSKLRRYSRYRQFDQDHQKRLIKTLQEYREAQNEHIIKQCQNFFHNLDGVNPNKRLSQTYKFIRKYRLKKKSKCTNPNISISQWENELSNFCKGPPPPLMNETGPQTNIPPPSMEQISDIMHNMRNGTAPGVDRIYVEMLKYAPEELQSIIHMLILNAWESNTIPKDWTTTTQVPLPKTSNPKTVDDFRRIALSCTTYKIYARFLLNKLEPFIGEFPLYQTGFLRNRSTDDHLFVLRRLTEERWRVGRPTYILSLDMHKAFDNVDLHTIGPILLHYGVPPTLINRIITAVLHERTAVQWFGRRTKEYTKGKGVKQGCPLSPYIFIIVLNYAIERVAQRMKIDLQLSNLELPLILAYADDLLILTEDAITLERILKELWTPVDKRLLLLLLLQRCLLMACISL